MSDTVTIDYGLIFGIKSVAAAVVFTILFAFLTVYYIWHAITRFNYIFVFVAAFCMVRVAGFAVRAAIAGSLAAATSLGLAIADQILFGMGFAGLLFATFSLHGDRSVDVLLPLGVLYSSLLRERIAEIHFRHPILLVLTHRRLFRLCIVAAVALFIAGTDLLTNPFLSPDAREIGNDLRKAGTWVLLGLTATIAFRSLLFIHHERTKAPSAPYTEDFFCNKYTGSLLILTSACLVIRMVYSVATVMMNTSQSEKSWYPLNALPEFLCACFIATPGLVLSRKELKENDIKLEGYNNRPTVDPRV